MAIDIYKLKQDRTFIAVAAGQTLPQRKFTMGATFFKRVDVCPLRPRLAMDDHQVLADIAEQGWAVWGIAIIIELT